MFTILISTVVIQYTWRLLINMQQNLYIYIQCTFNTLRASEQDKERDR